MSTIFARTCIAVAACVAVMTCQPRALAVEPSGLASVEVRELFPFTFRYKLDDLASPRGARRVYLELKKQARRACAAGAVSGSRILRTDQQCIAELTTSVVQRIASPNLMAQQDYVR